MDRLQEGRRMKFPYEQACIALFVCLALLMFAAYLQDIADVMAGLMMALFIIWQVVRGLVIKRYFWRIPDEKTSFWSLLAALLLGGGVFWLCAQAP